jgi:hypothetical protein
MNQTGKTMRFIVKVRDSLEFSSPLVIRKRYASDNSIMKVRKHIRLLIFVTLAWLLFWIAGLPDYYQQYFIKFMVIFDLAILSPIWFIIYRSAKHSKPGCGLKVCLWWSFYISFPLFIYDTIYCGFYLGHSISFLTKYWYITVYYILPWLIFPITGWLVDKRRSFALQPL